VTAAIPGCCARSSLPRADLLIIDDWEPETLSADRRRDQLEIVEDRYDFGSILITSQIPVDRWYEIIGNPTLADAILDRVVHNAYRIDLTGESSQLLTHTVRKFLHHGRQPQKS
jgi:DNA replication protein DnaC